MQSNSPDINASFYLHHISIVLKLNVFIYPTGMFRRKTACLWWTNTKSTSALKPNCGFWRSSLASRIHPNPSKIVPFASYIACTISKTHPDSSPSTSTAVPPHSTTGEEEEETPVLHHPKNDLQEEFDIQTFVFLFHIDKLSHTENHAVEYRISSTCVYIYIYMDIKHWTLPQTTQMVIIFQHPHHTPPLPNS